MLSTTGCVEYCYSFYRTKESRTSLEGVNANLTVQVSLAGKKLNESKERHRAQLQKANDLWLKYEVSYCFC